MTYLVYLNNYDIRQCKAQYLSVLYEVLGKNLDAHFILNKDYIYASRTNRLYSTKNLKRVIDGR